MKKILFARHAKASNFISSNKDHDRELSLRGIQDAKNMGKRLFGNNIFPDLYITSSAKRAKSTCEIIKRELKNDSEVIIDERIYYNGIKGVLDNICSVNNNIKFIAMFGHNPTFEGIYNAAKGSRYDKLPTCGMLLCDFDVDDWKYFSIETSEVQYYDFPNNIK